MIKTVFDILEQINKGNFDELPKKVKVEDEWYVKDKDAMSYISENSDIEITLHYNGMCNLKDFLQLPVEEVKENKKWEPIEGEKYYYVDSAGRIVSEHWDGSSVDQYRFLTRNCFMTIEEARPRKDNIKTYYELKNLADELNNGREIDWEDENQTKFYLYLAYDEGTIQILKNSEWTTKSQGTIYCLDSEFNNEAIEKIGNGRLVKLLMEE